MKRYLLFILALFLVTSPTLAQEPEPYRLYLPLVGKCSIPGFEPMSDWRVIVPEATTNYCLNPSAETTGNYTAEAGTTVDRSTTYQKYGLYSYRIQTDAADEGIELTLSALTNAIHTITVRVRGTLPTTWAWSLDDGNWHIPELVEAIDSNWDLYSVEIPAAQANASTKLSIHQSGAGSGDFYIDGIQVEPTEDYYTTYCDGTQDGCAWNGAENASTSTRSAVSRAGGRIYDLQDDYSLDIGGVTGAGAAQVRLTDDPYAMLPGGQLNSAKIQSRTFSLSGVIRGTSTADLNAKRQALVELFAHDAYPKDADGWQPVRLRYAGAAVQKEIAAHYEGGLELDIRSTDPCYWERVTVRFFAPDPFWYEIGNSAVLLDSNDTPTMRYIAGRLKNTGQWDDLGLANDPAAAGTPYAILYASNGLVYVGGIFTSWGNVAGRDNIVAYNPVSDTWSTVGGASDVNGGVNALAEGADGTIYMGGLFTDVDGIGDADYLVAYDPSANSFAAIGQPVQGAASITAVYSLAFNSIGDLYIGGQFENWADIANADGLVMWDGSAYNAVGAPAITGASYVHTVAIDANDYIYIGGSFLNCGGVGAADYMAFYNGTAWAAIGGITPSGAIYSIVWDNQRHLMYLGGTFSDLAGISGADNVASFNGNSFQAMDQGLSQIIWRLTLDEQLGNIWAVGATNTIALWNGSVWTTPDIVVSGTFHAFAIGSHDPVIQNKYDVYLGITASGVAEIGGLVIADNEGTTSVYPVIKINRSGGTTATLYTVRNETTGLALWFSYMLLDGETLTIDLSPTAKSIRSSMFGSRMDAILNGSDFGMYNLEPGNNDVTCLVAVTGAPTITAWMEYKDKYHSLD